MAIRVQCAGPCRRPHRLNSDGTGDPLCHTCRRDFPDSVAKTVAEQVATGTAPKAPPPAPAESDLPSVAAEMLENTSKVAIGLIAKAPAELLQHLVNVEQANRPSKRRVSVMKAIVTRRNAIVEAGLDHADAEAAKVE